MKSTYLYCLTGLIVLMTGGCSDDKTGDSEIVFLNNMEASYAWSEFPQRNLIYSPNAHSGRYVCIIDSANVFGITYTMKMANVDPSPLKRVKVGAWFNAQQDGSDPNLAIDIRDSLGNTIDWISQNSQDLSKRTGTWEWMEMSIDLTAKNRNAPGNSLRIYAFNKMPAPCLVDDFEVRYEK